VCWPLCVCGGGKHSRKACSNRKNITDHSRNIPLFLSWSVKQYTMLKNYNPGLKRLARNLRNNGTKAEACLWKYVLKAGSMKQYTFKRQRPVLNFIADFCCEELKLIIEVDGLTHDLPDIIANDSRKDAALTSAGYTVLRFTNNEVLHNINAVGRCIEEWIDNRS